MWQRTVVAVTNRDWPLLAGLTPAQRAEVLALTRRRSFARNEVVCHASDPADSLHLVTEGHLAVRVSTDGGDSALVRVLGPGDYFGEVALLRTGQRRTATITSLEASVTLSLNASAFRRLCQANPEVERSLGETLADRIDQLSQQLLEALYVGLDRRLHRRLVELAATYAAADGASTIPLTQSQLAELVGGTRPSVNQALQRLVEQGIVSLGRGRIVVRDRARLARKAGLPAQ